MFVDRLYSGLTERACVASIAAEREIAVVDNAVFSVFAGSNTAEKLEGPIEAANGIKSAFITYFGDVQVGGHQQITCVGNAVFADQFDEGCTEAAVYHTGEVSVIIT